MAHDIPDAISEVDRRTLLRASLGLAAVAVVGTELATGTPAAAAPSSEFPWIIDCDSWGARPPSSTIQLTNNTTNKIILHHMAFPNVTDYSREQAVKLAQDCQDLHMDGNGWADTGQHFTVSRGGYVLEGRHRSLERLEAGDHQVVAAHCPGENGNAIGIENEGTYITEVPPDALLNSLVRLCVAVSQRFGLHAWDIFGHWDFRFTDCPGIEFYKLFPSVRSRVAEAMGSDHADIPDRRWPDIWRFVNSPIVQVGQYLLNHHGYAVPTDGAFGSATVAAVGAFQAANGIPVDADATFTLATWEALVVELEKDATGLPVSAVQYMLNRKGWPEVLVTGEYDHVTMKAVQDMQRLHGLHPNGKVDLSTWCAVVGGAVREAFQY
ncbi:peptidoglycan hydrolase-like protein with peptidoglycan-binding domain [Hamadaea flava]|uniref:N-acetylmuramoyl-L-alanine amidase n=1 Tax=Hamadaea flava TaxID=1742688 RepID=A0ABV8LYT7_9ACTN|nr:N-acetylmuramoyl-L-alanine amidase [Hamadaea flava]MCP2322064.1 peptidoglycan hydrolase-like protein with peptidoglycan-binding domain [Hamadaea flava]